MKDQPPRLAKNLLRSFLRDDLAEEVAGDLEEKFYSTLRNKSLFRAQLNYWYQVFQYLRPFAIRKSKSTHLNHYTMFQNYFKSGMRNLSKNKTYSFINIGGLAIGLACCITIGLYVWDEYSYDRFHTHFKEIYRVVEIQNQAGLLVNIASTPGPLAAALKTDFAEIQQTCRLGFGRPGLLQFKEVTVEPAAIVTTDNSFFSLFDFKLARGNPQKALLEPDEVVITSSIAKRLFGPNWEVDNKLLGQHLLLNNSSTLTIAGVAEDPPPNSHIQFDVLLPMRYEELKNWNNLYSWDNNNYHTYIRLLPGTNASTLGENILNFMKPFKTWSNPDLLLQPLSDIYLHSNFDHHTNWNKTGSIAYIRIFLAVGLIVLLIALFNFINLSTARATQRAKEVGIRKVIGAFRRHLVLQFLSESLLMTVLAMVLSLILLQFFVPLLNGISGKSLSVPITQPFFILVILGMIALVSFLAGVYPSFYLSSFQPARVIKGFFKTISGQLFRRTLVVTQFTFSMILVLGAIVIYQQLTYMQDKSLGFDKSQLIFLQMKNQLYKKAALMKTDLENQTSIIGVSVTSRNLIDVSGSTHSIKWEGQGPDDIFPMVHLNIDADFLPTTGMTLIAGRNFYTAMSSDSASWLINETAAKRMGWTPDQAIGKELTLWKTQGIIVGVVKDFHFRPMTTTIEPILFRYWPKDFYSGFLVRAKPHQVREAISAIEESYKAHEPQTAAQYEFVDDALENQYRAEQNTGRIVLYFSILAILVSSLGLFGLATFTTEQRTKEIGIRKVLGASVTGLVSLLSRDFIRLVVIAMLIASPVAWWAMNSWLDAFAYRIEVQWWMFAVSGIIAISIALMTVSFQSAKAALMNPVESLKTE